MVAWLQISKDFEQEKLEEEMKKRRERVEKWRSIKGAASTADPSEETQAPRKIWSLENDDDDEEEEVEAESKKGEMQMSCDRSRRRDFDEQRKIRVKRKSRKKVKMK